MRFAELRQLGVRQLVRRTFKVLRFRRAEAESLRWKARFEQAASADYVNEPSSVRLENLQAFSFAGAGQFHLQVLSILSFLRHVGIPQSWTVASDGSLTPEMIARLRDLHSCVQVLPWEEFVTDGNRAAIKPYAEMYPLGKKLAVLTAMPALGSSIYADSDVLFFAGAHRLRELLKAPPQNYYVRDVGNAVIGGLALPADQQLIPVNSGLLIQMRPIAWAEPLERLHRCLASDPQRYEPEKHYLEQTVAHLAYHASAAQALDAPYALTLADAFEADDLFCGENIVMRHYILHTRFKFWLHAREYLR